ncbi:MAG TPA: ACT domain-containing protein [Gammaproteobacteria bacterium]|nr:glycine cleavage system protein R [Gammaproteobacteria bacterium]MDP7153544.1 ACT domain-containing protein [Gammaproteobacteria bacterium]MDP7296296.1 ACT domain-containing protein [Gammaproteobacteria bacterium]HJP38495.1 ACT domain-containing protein [Gammaproteobacteria bacterium]
METPPANKPPLIKQLAITIIGPDRAGLIRDLSKIVTEAAGNIQESRMIALGSEFALLMLVSGNWHAVASIREKLDLLQDGGKLTIAVRDSSPRANVTAAPYAIDVVSLDHQGIVLELSNFFAARDLEIAELNTRQYNAAHTGAQMFGIQMTVNIPADIQLSILREEFMEFCDNENLDAIMEPAAR